MNLLLRVQIRCLRRAYSPLGSSTHCQVRLRASRLRATFSESGSGLSRRDLVTPDATVKLLVYAKRQPWSDVFFGSLPEAGLDGTLGRRFRESAAKGRLRAKTGTRDGVSSLAGYLVTRSNRTVAFSVMVNNATVPPRAIREAIDAVVVELLDE